MMRPILDRVLVRREESKDTTDGGIIIPDVAKEKLNRGTVLGVGAGKVLENGRRVEPAVKTGDRIVFGKYSGQEFDHDGERHLLMLREEEILGVVEE